MPKLSNALFLSFWKHVSYCFHFVVVGIDIDEFRYSRNAFGIFSNFPEYTFQVWDFAGQEEFYTTHQCFLSTLALYLLVWNLEEGIVVMEIFLSM